MEIENHLKNIIKAEIKLKSHIKFETGLVYHKDTLLHYTSKELIQSDEIN